MNVGENLNQFSREHPPGCSHRKRISPRWFRGKWWWSSQVTDLRKPIAATSPQEIMCLCVSVCLDTTENVWIKYINKDEEISSCGSKNHGNWNSRRTAGKLKVWDAYLIIHIIYNISLTLFKIEQTPKPSLQIASRPRCFPVLPGAQLFVALRGASTSGASPGLEDDGVTLMHWFTLHVSRHDKSVSCAALSAFCALGNRLCRLCQEPPLSQGH